ncbi:NAD(P)H-dependent glycerol-3-phosphate dehydrogenase [Candidatus Vondammii sp. HM_W22]|uniref:NAD(P)H-dependent glycerol-3-phosphate dehydrogenase n=1 Tax=Candidatus Vondammii sp. HM_W22 TaxID=2687299 RepID=UPI001F138E67|nr:NAD(P)H-dependent glycerol-3-phosphate dehydrogenase [Candidatus Vondammii sp. HM_W22]
MTAQHPVIAVLGSGSWGTALAILLSRNGAIVRLWGHLATESERLHRDGENREFLPGYPFPGGLSVTADLGAALQGAEEVIIVVPSHAFKAVLEKAVPMMELQTSLSWATKGVEPQTLSLLHEVAADLLGDKPTAVISGPSFASEVAKRLPTAVTVASSSPEHAEKIAGYLHSDCFRAYTSDDIIGLEVGGAAKNVMAIGAGIADGLGFGANTRAALITRGLAEIMRLGMALGGKRETLMGLGGMGDLVLTCTDDQSRNRRMGLALAQGLSIDEAKQEIGQEVEGVMTAQAIYNKARKLGVEMPITEQVYRVLHQNLDPKEAVQNLLGRRKRQEAG